MAFDYSALSSLSGMLGGQKSESKPLRFNVNTGNTGFGKIGASAEDEESEGGPLPTNQKTFKSSFKKEDEGSGSRFSGVSQMIQQLLSK